MAVVGEYTNVDTERWREAKRQKCTNGRQKTDSNK